MSQVLKKIARKHKDWVRMVKSFGCRPEIAEDIVQEMYLKIHDLLQKGLDISYNDDINYYYIYRTLKNSYFIYAGQESKIKKIGLDELEKYIEDDNANQRDIDVYKKMKEVDEVLSKVYWYDKKVFDLITSGLSIAELSRQSDISYASLYNTYRKVKTTIKDNVKWD